MKRSYPLGKFSNGSHSSRTIMFVEKFYCPICREILTGFSTQMKSTPTYQSFDAITVVVQSLLGQENKYNFRVRLDIQVHVS